MQYTEKQQLAFGTRDRTLLVSAAAGSGKTAVLTKRIIDSLLDEEHPTDITRLLIVTFTKAAALDMRAKITKSLGAALAEHPENKRLARQLMLIGGASISTIDSFYLDLVRSHFEEAGVSPTVRVADETELIAEKKDFMNRALDSMYRDFPAFTEVSDVLCDLRSEDRLTDALLDIYDRLSSYPSFLDVLTESADELEAHAATPLDSAMGKAFLAECRRYTDYGRALCRTFDDLLSAEEETVKLTGIYGEAHRELAEKTDRLAAALEQKNYAVIQEVLALSFSARVRGGKRPPMSVELSRAAEAESAFRKAFGAFCNTYAVFSEKEVEESAFRTAALLRLIHTALTRYHTAFSEWKTQRELCEFGDITHAAYHLLVGADGAPSDTARAVAAEYDAIYIDEYQDVNALQDATFAAISTPRNRFMVGDIKQSIYRFRGSEPAVFAGYRKAFPEYVPGKDGDNGSVIMSECFRCDKPIIDFTNTVFRFLFSRHAKRIGYTPADDLNFAKSTEGRAPDYTPPPCEVFCITSDTEKEETGEEETERENPEIRLIVREIQRLLSGETKADGTKITPADIAVLIRSGALSAPLTAALEAAGIPVNNTFKKNLFENPEVLCVYSLLAVIDNPLRDIYLAATLRSPFFDFTLPDLVNIRAGAGDSFSLYEAVCAVAEGSAALAGKCRTFLDKLNRWRALAVRLPVDKLLRELYRETSVLSFAGDAAHRTNLERLYEYARSFEANGFQGLYRFIRFVDEMMKNGAEIDEGESGGDAVSVLTIHHSKGLEFPVCFVAGTGSAFSGKDLVPSFLTDAALGCAITLPDAGPISRCNTFWRRCVAGELATLAREEEMRVLYVALTRARERLIVTGKSRKKPENLEKEIAFAADPVAGFFATAGNSYLSWILTALEADGTGTHTELHYLTDSAIPEIEAQTQEETAAGESTGVSEEELRERLHFRYPYEYLSKLPAKLSVSRLTPQILDVFDTDGAPSPAELLSPDAEQLLRSFDRPFAPEPGDNAPTAAERGTATHEFLQFCDLARARADVNAELERLIALGFLPETARVAVRKDELAAFFESGFYNRLAGARNVWRETRFNIFLPAREFTGDAVFAAALGEEKLLVQGVIDLFFEDTDGKLILCDYKTDRLSPYELTHPAAAAKTLFDRHRQQLSYYRKAILQITGRAPDKILIYSLPAGTAFADPDSKTEV